MPRIELVGGPRDGELREVPATLPDLYLSQPTGQAALYRRAMPFRKTGSGSIMYQFVKRTETESGQ